MSLQRFCFVFILFILLLASSCSFFDKATPVENVTIDQSLVTLGINDTVQLTALVSPLDASDPSVIWKSSDPSIATVSSSGMVYSIRSGNVTITATSTDGECSASCKIIINIKFLFLGNSITKHGPAPELGWYGDWGMAATSEDKDYVHVLIDKLKQSNANIEYKVQNIASWERDFTYDLSTFTEIRDYHPDILIVRIGENVNVIYAKANSYQSKLEDLINYYKTGDTEVYITNCFWQNTYKDNVHKTVALVNNYSFIDIDSLSTDDTNYAYLDFENYDVAYHPSDFGMHNIACIIFNAIQKGDLF